MPDYINPKNSTTKPDDQEKTSSSIEPTPVTTEVQSLGTSSLDSPVTASTTDTQAVSTQRESVPQTPQTPQPAQMRQDDTIPTPKVISSHIPQKYGGKKIIATIFGVLLLIGGVASGVFLVQRQQQLEQLAASGKECSQSPDCILLDDEKNQGSFTAPRLIIRVLITDKDIHEYFPGDTDDGCRRVTIRDNYVSWDRYGSGSSCKDVSNVQIWLGQLQPSLTPTTQPSATPTQPPGQTPTPTKKISPSVTPKNTATPTPTKPSDVTAQCFEVVAYDTQWNPLSQSELTSLKPGDKVRFAVAGTTSSGSFDKARFTINGTLYPEVVVKKPGSDEYYYEYTIPQGVTNFTVKGELHHTSLGWI